MSIRVPQEVLYYTLSPCSLGLLLLAASDKGVCALLLGDQENERELITELNRRFPHAKLQQDMTRKLDTWLQQILNWLNDPAQASEPPLDPHGTVFQQQVWQALRRIPCGQTRQYGELAKELGSHARAVANACARNPIALLVPCHRVVGSKGLTGYRWGLQRKAALLELERAQHANLTSPPLPHVQ